MHARIPSISLDLPPEDAASRPSFARSDSVDGLKCQSGEETDFDDELEGLSEPDSEDFEAEENTLVNGVYENKDLEGVGSEMLIPGEGPNFTREAVPSFAAPTTTSRLRRKPTKSKDPLPISHGRALFERDRCTIVVTAGDPSSVERKSKLHLVATDGSVEGGYALDWAIGTVLRDGDEVILTSVLETDTKFDGDDNSASDKKAKLLYQKERQMKALVLSRQATALLERTRLNITVSVQVVHAKNCRWMLVDMIAVFEPTLVIVGSRGLSRLRASLLGSVSAYLVEKSSSPVMVCRRPLRRSSQIPRSLHLHHNARVHLADAVVDAPSRAGASAENLEKEGIRSELASLSIGGTGV